MASIRKRGDYQWQARVIRKGMCPISKTFPTRQAAEEWASGIETKIISQDYVDTQHLTRYTLTDLLDDVLTLAVPHKKGAQQEETFIGRLKKCEIASLPLAAITEITIRDYRNMRLGQVSPTTVVKEMGMISSYYNFAISELSKYRGLSNPVQKVRRPKQNSGRTRRCTDEEARWIIEHTESECLGDVIRIAIDTAMRRGEILGGVLVENIDMEHRVIDLFDTKNGTARTVAFSSALVPVFERRIAGRASGKLFHDDPGVATRAFGRAVLRARAAYEAQCAKEGIEPKATFLRDIRLHDMRHEATSRMFEDHNLSIQEVSSMTGHMDLKMLKRYTHMTARRIAEKLG